MSDPQSDPEPLRHLSIATHEAVVMPIHRAGWPFIGLFALVTLALGWLWLPLGVLGLLATGWCVAFFRDPPRRVPTGPGLVISPADGVVQAVVPATPPSELELGPEDVGSRISIFMNVFNVHVNRSPVPATVGQSVYVPGRFLNASLDKASAHNERRLWRLDMADGTRLAVVQIAGLVARRIVALAEPGQPLAAGERLGLIRFGSRVDVYLPPGVEPRVWVGQKAVAGETLLADLSAARVGEPAPAPSAAVVR